MLDIENIGRIGQMFLDGDSLENLLNDRFTCDDDNIDYKFDLFNQLKISLMKIERINPDYALVGVIWYWYPTNRQMATPVIAGRKHPYEGWVVSPCKEELTKTLKSGTPTSMKRPDETTSYFWPIKNSDAEIVGALELIEGYPCGLFEVKAR